jgi:hypothetical protein
VLIPALLRFVGRNLEQDYFGALLNSSSNPSRLLSRLAVAFRAASCGAATLSADRARRRVPAMLGFPVRALQASSRHSPLSVPTGISSLRPSFERSIVGALRLTRPGHEACPPGSWRQWIGRHVDDSASCPGPAISGSRRVGGGAWRHIDTCPHSSACLEICVFFP